MDASFLSACILEDVRCLMYFICNLECGLDAKVCPRHMEDSTYCICWPAMVKFVLGLFCKVNKADVLVGLIFKPSVLHLEVIKI